MTFIDTGAFLARYLPSDQHHKVATALWEKIRASHERFAFIS
jgi:predicted nucleic acid-binding protein